MLPWTQASLGEVLQVRGEPLSEHEIWAVLIQSINTVKRIMKQGLCNRLLIKDFWIDILPILDPGFTREGPM